MDCPNVLIIEDDQDIRELCQEFLQGEGYPSDVVSNGKEAIEYLKEHKEPCVILLDMMMPVMNGREFMEEMEKSEHTLAQIPVYLVSASAQLNEGRDIGCFGFLKKPYELSDILTIVKTHCESALQKQAPQPGLVSSVRKFPFQIQKPNAI